MPPRGEAAPRRRRAGVAARRRRRRVRRGGARGVERGGAVHRRAHGVGGGRGDACSKFENMFFEYHCKVTL